MKKLLVYITLFLNINIFTDFHFHHHDSGMVNRCFCSVGKNIFNDDDHDHEALNCFICRIRKHVQVFPQKQVFYVPIAVIEKKIYTFTFQSLFSQVYLSTVLSRAPPIV